MLLLLGAVALAAHCAVNFRYGFFRDELYYIQWSERLAWGYVEQPPFTALAVYITRLLLGHSLFALRFPPALVHAALVVLTGLMAREMGGKRLAQGLAALCVLLGPIFMANNALMTMNSFDQLFWALCLYILIRRIQTGNARLWYWFGLWAGLGLMNKLTMGFFGVGLIIALLLTSYRKDFLRKEIWIGGAIAAALFAPFVIWLATHDWCTIEFMRQYGAGGKTVQAGFLQWLYMQILTVHPLTLPIWLLGLWSCFMDAEGKRFRVLAWFFVVMYAMFFALKAKFYFLSPAFPILFAAGAVPIERWCMRPARRAFAGVYLAILALTGAALAPLAMAVLPVPALLKYTAAIGVNAGVTTEQVTETELPQHFADQFGWEAMVESVAKVYHGLPPEDRAQCAIFTANYGEAAAIDFYGPAHGLPPAISGHNTYYIWGPGHATGQVLIAVVSERRREALEQVYEDVRLAGRNDNAGLAMPYERGQVFYLCRGLKAPLEEIWPGVKSYN
ncbi:MAG: glycosyltransferase family 39 protein [Candidatus Hydrogenedentes bacterium]|nr:glycosyltransferase family 39 protein [Candidatus Hydrogenedentota bacterium]